MSGIGTDHKSLLSETVDDGPAAFDICRGAGGDDKKLPRLGGIGISEDRRRDVALAVARMLAGEVGGSGRTDRAHREMNRARHQPKGKTVEAEIGTPEHDVMNSRIVRQHADDDLAVEKVADIRCGIETERSEPVYLVGATDIRDHAMSGCGEIHGHRRAHVTKPDKADLTLRRPARVQSRTASLLDRPGVGWSGQDERGARIVLAHRAPFDHALMRRPAHSDPAIRTRPDVATGRCPACRSLLGMERSCAETPGSRRRHWQ